MPPSDRLPPPPDPLHHSRAPSREDDVHVMPSWPEHIASSACWCGPAVDYVADNGVRVWLHREVH
jgi:hypothetical protein